MRRGLAASLAILLIATLGVLVVTPLVQPRQGIFYVGTHGDDRASGGADQPWQTLQHAVDRMPEGSTVVVGGGTYAPVRLTRSGLTIEGAPGETAVIEGSAGTRSALSVDGVHGLSIRNITVIGNVTQYGAGIMIDDSTGVALSNLVVHDNRSFGIKSSDSDMTITDSDIYGNASGIEVAYGGATQIRNNRIHDNDHMVDPGVGGQGISFYKTTGSAIAEGNTIYSNHLQPGDPTGSDGTGFEIYGASNVVMTKNTLWDNESVLETGTDGPPCANITYTRNVAYRREAFHNVGLILRCASHTLVANNVFDGYDKFAFDLSQFEGRYGGSIEGLRIVNNLVLAGRMYSIDTLIPASVVVDYNCSYVTAATTAQYGHASAWVKDHDQTTVLADFTAWTGLGAHDVWGVDPLVDADYQPLPGSPLIDRGVDIGEPFAGRAPDIGAHEAQPADR